MKKFLLVVGILAVAMPAMASVSATDSTSIQYLDNYGYSDSMNNYIQTLKANKNGQEYYASNKFRPELKYYNHNKVWNGIVNGTRAFFHYIDPAEDEGLFLHTDIKYHNDALDAH